MGEKRIEFEAFRDQKHEVEEKRQKGWRLDAHLASRHPNTPRGKNVGHWIKCMFFDLITLNEVQMMQALVYKPLLGFWIGVWRFGDDLG